MGETDRPSRGEGGQVSKARPSLKVLLRGWEKDAPPDFCVKGRCEG